jgi:hypothetical protein
VLENRKKFESLKITIENTDPTDEVFDIAVKQLRLLAILDNIEQLLLVEIIVLDYHASHILTQLKLSLPTPKHLQITKDEISHPESPLNETINSLLSAD